MTIPANTLVSGPYVPDGVNTTWDFDFKVTDATQLVLILVDPDGVETEVTSGFTVPADDIGTDDGGTITYPTSGGPLEFSAYEEVYVTRAVPYTQPNKIGNQGNFYPQTHEDTMDLLAMQVQQLDERLDRTVTVPVSASASDLEGLIADILALADIQSDITAVSGIKANVTTVAGISGNVTTVAGISSEVAALSALTSEITALDAVSAEIASLGLLTTEIGALGALTSEITALDAISADITSVAAVDTDVTTVATNIADIILAAANVADLADKLNKSGGTMTGNLGIGASPSTKLEVSEPASDVEARLSTVSSGDITLGFNMNGLAYNWIKTDRATGSMALGTYNTERARINGINGNFGIGGNPSDRLHVNDPVAHSSGFKNFARFTMPNLTGGALSLGFGKEAANYNLGKLVFNYSGDGSTENSVGLGFWGNDNVLVAKGNGKVGIGTSDPQQLAHLKAASPNILLEGTSYPALKFAGTDLTTDAEIYYGIGASDLTIKNHNAGPINITTQSGLAAEFNPDRSLTLRGSNGTSINGSTQLKFYYTGSHFLNTIGSVRSEGSLAIGFGVEPSTTVPHEYLSTADNASFARSTLVSGQDLRFKTAGAQTTAIGTVVPLTERFTVLNDGNVGINNPAPDDILEIGTFNSSGASSGSLFRAGGTQRRSSVTGTSSANHNEFYNGNGPCGSITTNGTSTAYNTTSDHRLKVTYSEITDATALDKIMALPVYDGAMKKNPLAMVPDDTIEEGSEQLLVLAHEVKEIFPHLVTGDKDDVDINGDPVWMLLNYPGLIVPLIAAIQELKRNQDALDARITALEAV